MPVINFIRIALTAVLSTLVLGAPSAAEIKIGMIGLDTSHVIEFTRILNDATAKDHVPGGKVVAAFKGGSPDLPDSRDRVEGYTKTLQAQYGVELVPTIEELCRKVDAVMIESVDGRPHLAQARPVIAAGKPLFIDKPVAGTLDDAIEIFRLAKEKGVPCFSSSAYRYYDGLVELKGKDIGELRGAISYGPANTNPTHPDLFWYGVHATEALFAVMGTGCESVVRTATPDTDVVTGVWIGGRVGTLIGLRDQATPHKVIAFGTKAVAEQREDADYRPLVAEIVKFFETRIAPVSAEESIQIFAFMEAADESKRQGGAPVRIEDVIRKHSK